MYVLVWTVCVSSEWEDSIATNKTSHMGLITECGAEACGHKRGERCLCCHSESCQDLLVDWSWPWEKYTQHRNCCRSFSRSSERQPEDSILKPASLLCEWLSWADDNQEEADTERSASSLCLSESRTQLNKCTPCSMAPSLSGRRKTSYEQLLILGTRRGHQRDLHPHSSFTGLCLSISSESGVSSGDSNSFRFMF